MDPIDAPASGHWLSFFPLFFSFLPKPRLWPTLEGQSGKSQLQILCKTTSHMQNRTCGLTLRLASAGLASE